MNLQDFMSGQMTNTAFIDAEEANSSSENTCRDREGAGSSMPQSRNNSRHAVSDIANFASRVSEGWGRFHIRTSAFVILKTAHLPMARKIPRRQERVPPQQ